MSVTGPLPDTGRLVGGCQVPASRMPRACPTPLRRNTCSRLAVTARTPRPSVTSGKVARMSRSSKSGVGPYQRAGALCGESADVALPGVGDHVVAAGEEGARQGTHRGRVPRERHRRSQDPGVTSFLRQSEDSSPRAWNPGPGGQPPPRDPIDKLRFDTSMVLRLHEWHWTVTAVPWWSTCTAA